MTKKTQASVGPIKNVQKKKTLLQDQTPGGPLVFKGGYHVQVWPLKTDPKQGFYVDSKRHPKPGFWRFFLTLNKDFLN